MVVLGAGGTARAVVYGLSERGVKRIHVVNRTLERATALREEFGKRVNPVRWEELGGLLAGAGLLVNTTSLGMTGKPPLSVNLARLPASAVVADVVYAPLETALLACGARARAAHRRRSRDAAASGGARFRAVVRRAAGGHAGFARSGRGRPAAPTGLNPVSPRDPWEYVSAAGFAVRAPQKIGRNCYEEAIQILAAVAAVAVWSLLGVGAKAADARGQRQDRGGRRLDGGHRSGQGRGQAKVKLKDKAVIMTVGKATLAEVKPGAYIGVGAMPQADGSQKAVRVMIFPEMQRGTGEGHYPWKTPGSVPNSTMTNATVDTTVAASRARC